MNEKTEIETQVQPPIPPPVAVPTGGPTGAAGKEEKVGNVEIEEQVHHEHVEEISPELETLLQTDPLQGLSDDEVERRRETFGRNELIEKKRHPLLKFLGYFTGAIAYLIEIAVICSAVVGVSRPTPSFLGSLFPLSCNLDFLDRSCLSLVVIAPSFSTFILYIAFIFLFFASSYFLKPGKPLLGKQVLCSPCFYSLPP